MKPQIIVGCLALLLTCCQGVRFSAAPVNQPLPDTFTQRALYPAGVAGYEFQDLVGNILLIKEPEAPLRVGVVRPDGYASVVIPITDPNNYYRSRIQLGAEVQGKYLAFAGKFSADDMAEITLIDIARAGVPIEQPVTWTDILTKLTTWVQQHPKKDPNSRRVWVKATVLSRRVYQSQTKIEADASGQVGDVVGVKTGVYRKSEADIKSVDLGFEAFDVDRLVSESKNDSIRLLNNTAPLILRRSAFSETIHGEIRDR